MTKHVPAAAVFATLIAATNVQAQSTAETYLQELVDLYAAQGFTLEYGSKDSSGSGLTVSDVVMRASNEQSDMTMTLDSLTFTEIDDPVYDVEVTNGPEFAGEVTSTTEGESVTINFDGTLAGSMRIGGPADDRVMTMDYSSIVLNYAIPQLETEGGDMDMSMSMSDIGGTLGYSLALATQVYDMTVGTAGLTMNIAPPEGGDVAVQVSYTDIEMSGTAPIADMADPGAIFSVDADFDLRMDTGPYTSTVRAETPDGSFDMVSNGASSFFEFNGGRGQLDYSAGGTDLEVLASGSAIPLPPIAAQIAETDMRFALPVAPTDGNGKAAVRINLDGVSVSEELWAIVDPGGVVPRDPAKILIDLEGDADASVNIMDPENAAAMLGMPFTFENATLKALDVSFGGANVTGSGDVVMNNAGPFPMPKGAVDLRIAGINGLLEKLGQIGLVPPEQAMPVRMMLGMFAQPTDEADVFTTRIEADGAGGISANGVPLQ